METALRANRLRDRVSWIRASRSSAWLERQLRPGDLPRLGLLGLLQGRFGLGQLRLGLVDADLEWLLVDDQQELAGLDVGTLLESLLLEEPLDPGAKVNRLDGLGGARVLGVIGHLPPDGETYRHLGRRRWDIRVRAPQPAIRPMRTRAGATFRGHFSKVFAFHKPVILSTVACNISRV